MTATLFNARCISTATDFVLYSCTLFCFRQLFSVLHLEYCLINEVCMYIITYRIKSSSVVSLICGYVSYLHFMIHISFQSYRFPPGHSQ